MPRIHTDLTLLLDASGSMSSVRMETISSINRLIQEQKDAPGTCNFSWAKFNTSYNVPLANVPIDNVGRITDRQYSCAGGTALYDALGATILALDDRYRSAPVGPSTKVVVITITDGHENASKSFKTSLPGMIRDREGRLDWQFVFMGCDQDAVRSAGTHGMDKAKALTFQKTSAGIENAFAAASAALGSMRRSGDTKDLEFTPSTKRKRQHSTI